MGFGRFFRRSGIRGDIPLCAFFVALSQSQTDRHYEWMPKHLREFCARRCVNNTPRKKEKPYELIGFGAMDVTKPYEFAGLGAMDVTKPYEFRWFLGGLLFMRGVTMGCAGGGEATRRAQVEIKLGARCLNLRG